MNNIGFKIRTFTVFKNCNIDVIIVFYQINLANCLTVYSGMLLLTIIKQL